MYICKFILSTRAKSLPNLRTGYIAPQLKLSKVVPSFKSGDKQDFRNVHAISLLSIFSKLQEKIVAKPRVGLLYKKNRYENLFGFRKRHHTFCPVLRFLRQNPSLFKQTPARILSWNLFSPQLWSFTSKNGILRIHRKSQHIPFPGWFFVMGLPYQLGLK